MPHLKEQPTIGDFQEYVRVMEIERGFSEQSVIQKCLLLGEEVGELFKAIRKSEKVHTDPHSKVGTIEEEISDILIMLCSVANKTGVDIEKAFRAKEERNANRKWV